MKPIVAEPSPDTSKDQQKKKPYRAPKLVIHGRVERLTQGAGSVGSDGGGSLTKNPKSDRATKENIVRVGTHPLGIGLYLFDYIATFQEAWGHERQFGVMADEVESVMPEAVSVGDDGFKQVDYAMLGINRDLH